MAVAGPSHFIDLTLDSESHLFDQSTSATDSRFIDLTLDSEDYRSIARSNPYQDSVIVLDDDGEIQTSTPFRANGRSTRAKPQKEVKLSDDEISVILSSSPVASSSKITLENVCKTSHLTELDGEAESWEEYYAPEYNEEDERLARQLAREEEESYNQLVETIENNKDGIVFSVVVNAADNTLEDGSPAHPDDLERFQPWKILCEQGGHKVAKFHWFVNYELEKRFELARDTLEAIMGERPPEMQLFHGTPAANIDSILKGGFKIGGVDGHPISHGAAMGYGIYLGAAASTSLGYAMGGNKIFACRVVPGRKTNMPVNHPPPSAYVGSEDFDCYEGHGVYVHRYASLVLPCYMIEFDIPQPQWNLLGGMIGAGMWGGGMALPAAVPAPLALPAPVPPKPRARRAPRKAKVPAADAAPTARKRARKTTADAEGAAVTPRKRQRKTQPAEANDDGDVAPPPTSSRKGKGKARV